MMDDIYIQITFSAWYINCQFWKGLRMFQMGTGLALCITLYKSRPEMIILSAQFYVVFLWYLLPIILYYNKYLIDKIYSSLRSPGIIYNDTHRRFTDLTAALSLISQLISICIAWYNHSEQQDIAYFTTLVHTEYFVFFQSIN